MQHTEGSFRGVDGLDLYYQAWRPEAAPRAVLAVTHGFGEHSGRYMNVVDHFVPRGYAAYGFDLRGHGRSPGKRGFIRAWSDYRGDTAAFLKMVAEKEPRRPLFLYGHSLGGLIVLDYVLHTPEGLKGVIASGPSLGAPGISPFLLALSRILSVILPSFAMDTKLDATTISRDPLVVKAYKEDPLVHSMGTARLGGEMNATVQWTQAHAQDIRLPLLIVQGAEDRLAPAPDSRRFFDHVTYADKERIEYPGGFHEPHNDIEHPKVMADIERWVERHL
ncbi:MAG: alpha/beta hydrolase [Anaerolineales bacterium]|nr:alpha/beta hydrolase [Anaerolineales bacterium]